LEVKALSKAKSDFISSISHELRSPLHGILAGVEMLRDTMKLESEISMLDSIDACGSLLLDNINHLLDYSKSVLFRDLSKQTTDKGLTPRRITNMSKRKQEDPSESPQDNESKTEVFPIVDLSTLVHDVVDGVCLGNIVSEKASDRETLDDTALTRSLRQGHPDQVPLRSSETGSLATLIDIDPSIDWKVKTEAAPWKRIVMNLFGNAMKFTQQGQITVRLRLARQRNAESEAAHHICVDVYDTGSGISKDYLNSYLFTPFSQESDISVGTGVGLSIVQKLVEGLSGSIDVQSDEGSGTRISVAIPLGKMTFPVNGQCSLLCEDAPLYANGRHKGNTLYVQSPVTYPDREHDQSADLTTTVDVDSNIRTFFANLAQHGFGMKVVVGSSNNDEPQYDGAAHSISLNGSNSGGAWTLSRSACLTGENAGNSKSNHASVRIRQPFGPRAFVSALDKIMAFTATAAQSDNASALKVREMEICNKECDVPSLSLGTSLSTEGNAPVVGSAQDQHAEHTNGMAEKGVQTNEPNQKSEKREAKAGKVAAHLLLVDDNAVNLKVLAASVKKGGCTFDQAMNGKEALEIFKLSTSTYDLIFMDLSMPVMNGIEATRKIREYERGTGNGKRTRIIALTALGNEEHRQLAFASGVDEFMTKPVKMKEIQKLVEQAGGR
jgi:signal transduction histidine kinase/CheY-like chemotaxis protein